MFHIAYIQEEGNGRLSQESALVREHCERMGVPVRLYTEKLVRRRQLPLDQLSFICGDMDCMHGAMRQLDIPLPRATYYPGALAPHLHRRVWLDTLGHVKKRVDEDGLAVFAKPASRAKAFTGQVFSHPSDFYHTGRTSLREPVWCSEIVSWQSEYRVYVIGREIVSVDYYDGDESVTPDLEIIRQAIADYALSGEAPAAYGIDFGVLATGETALVEANDGYALGVYRIGSEAYGRMVFARWRELQGMAVEA